MEVVTAGNAEVPEELSMLEEDIEHKVDEDGDSL